MIRLTEIAILSILLAFPGGCEKAGEKPIWDQVKIRDLAPTGPDGSAQNHALKTINFNVTVFELPAQNLGTLDNTWKMLYTRALAFANYEAFEADSLAVGFGRSSRLAPVINTIEQAQGKRIQNAALLLSDNQSDDMPVARLFERQILFYHTGGGALEKQMLGPGTMVMRVEAQKIPGLKGLCSLSTIPVFTVGSSSAIPLLEKRRRESEFAFEGSAFSLKMAVGDFFLLGPRQYFDEQITLSGLFFSKPQGSLFLIRSETDPSARKPQHLPAVRVFLFVCTGITY
ncbi:MAG: hypothetical protein ACYSWP_07355 [Planctomycetota bacterium]|jgi:hypothetical protein